MSTLDDLPVVGEAEWPRAGHAAVRIRLIASPRYLGTGDFDDPGDIAEDQPGESFLVAHDSAGSPGVFDNVIPGIASIDAAKALVEEMFPGARWLKTADA